MLWCNKDGMVDIRDLIMWIQFLLENTHFAVHIFAALVFFAVSWLYADAWKVKKTPAGLLRVIGFVLLSLSFVATAGFIENSVVASPLYSSTIHDILIAVLRLPSYVFLLVSLLIEPLVPLPGERVVPAGAHAAPTSVHAILVPAGVLAAGLGFTALLYPLLAVTVAFLYLRRATVGLEDHLKVPSYAFFLLSISELLRMATLFRGSTNITIFQFVAPFGPVWIAELVVVCLFSVLLGRWVFGYLLKQFNTQLFIIMTTLTIAIFLVTTVSFTGLLLKNIEDESLSQLRTDVAVLQYTLDSKKAENISDAEVVAQNAVVIAAVRDRQRTALADFSQAYLLTKKLSNVILVDGDGIVLTRGENRDHAGDSLSSDPLVKRALLGESAASVISLDGVVAPQLYLRAAVPVRDGATIVGVVITGTAVDTAFVDGMKSTTGLESSIYGDAKISATTLVSADGINRLAGIELGDRGIRSAVLTAGQSYTGSVTLASRAYYGSFLPLKDVDNTSVGMLFVGKPQTSVLAAAGRSIELTFLVTIALIVLSIIPAYAISGYIAYQIE